MEKFIMTDGYALRIAYTTKGDRTVVLLHGYLESLDVWDDFTTLLAPDLRVIAPDLPGHGISEIAGEVHTMEFMADKVAAAVEQLGVKKFTVVGHSMGGYVALEVLRKYSDRLSGIVLFHSTANADSEQKKEDRQREIDLVLKGKKDILARMNPQKRFAEDNIKRFADDIEDLADQVTLTEDEGIVAVLRGMSQRRDLNEVLQNSPVPVMLIFGRKDRHISNETAEAIAAANPRAEVLRLENSGHMGMIEEPELSAEAIKKFVQKNG